MTFDSVLIILNDVSFFKPVYGVYKPSEIALVICNFFANNTTPILKTPSEKDYLENWKKQNL